MSLVQYVLYSNFCKADGLEKLESKAREKASTLSAGVNRLGLAGRIRVAQHIF